MIASFRSITAVLTSALVLILSLGCGGGDGGASAPSKDPLVLDTNSTPEVSERAVPTFFIAGTANFSDARTKPRAATSDNVIFANNTVVAIDLATDLVAGTSSVDADGTYSVRVPRGDYEVTVLSADGSRAVRRLITVDGTVNGDAAAIDLDSTAAYVFAEGFELPYADTSLTVDRAEKYITLLDSAKETLTAVDLDLSEYNVRMTLDLIQTRLFLDQVAANGDMIATINDTATLHDEFEGGVLDESLELLAEELASVGIPITLDDLITDTQEARLQLITYTGSGVYNTEGRTTELMATTFIADEYHDLSINKMTYDVIVVDGNVEELMNLSELTISTVDEDRNSTLQARQTVTSATFVPSEDPDITATVTFGFFDLDGIAGMGVAAGNAIRVSLGCTAREELTLDENLMSRITFRLSADDDHLKVEDDNFSFIDDFNYPENEYFVATRTLTMMNAGVYVNVHAYSPDTIASGGDVEASRFTILNLLDYDVFLKAIEYTEVITQGDDDIPLTISNCTLRDAHNPAHSIATSHPLDSDGSKHLFLIDGKYFPDMSYGFDGSEEGFEVASFSAETLFTTVDVENFDLETDSIRFGVHSNNLYPVVMYFIVEDVHDRITPIANYSQDGTLTFPVLTGF